MILQGNSSSIAQGINEIWTGQTDLQPISFKSDRLLAPHVLASATRASPRLFKELGVKVLCAAPASAAQHMRSTVGIHEHQHLLS